MLKRKRKNPKAARDSKKYKKNRTRKFLAKWPVHGPWPQHDHDGVGVNFWASEN